MNIYELSRAFDPLYMILVNLYWLFFLVPGYAIWKYLVNNKIHHTEISLSAGFVFSFFYSSILLLPFNIFQFFVKIPSIILASYFGMTVIGGLYYLFKISDPLLSPKKIIGKIKQHKTGLGLFLSLLFSGYFVLGQIIKAFALYEFDAWMHISKINFMMHNGLSNLDPYLIEPGKEIIQSSFFSNLVHTIFVVPAKIFSFTSLDTPFVWYYSISVFSLFSYATIYFFIKKITQSKNLSIFIILVYFFTTFATQNQWLSQYPTRVAFLFALITFSFLIDYLWQEDKKLINLNLGLVSLGILSTSFLHQIIASLLAIFILGLAFITWLFKEIKAKKALFISLLSLLSLPTALYTKWHSTFMPTAVYKLSDSEDWILRLSNKFVMTKFPDQALTAIFLISIIGIIILGIVIKDKKNRLFIIYSLAFTQLLLYSPIFGIVNKFIPTWGIVRIDYYVIIINWLLIGIVLWTLIEYVFQKSVPDNTTRIWTISVVILMLSLPAQKDLKLFYDVASWNQGSYLYVKDLINWQPLIKEHSVILTDKSLSFSIPGIYNAYAAVLDNERTTDSIDTTERSTDLVDFYYNKKRSISKKKELINKYNIDYLIVRKKDQELFKDIDANMIGFKLVDSLADYKLYEKK